ncbi:hypothetical protein LCGC14_0758450 [marine sediment metagenome]|uniref:Uncharacterized protein n=1 Tax=marine sediment metagenome TaxID=412755 RepID=A0A0F9T923_9ZZZZ
MRLTRLHVLRTATYLLMNYIRLVAGIPTRMHFTDHYYIDRVVADRDTSKPKKLRSLVFWVDELDGEDVSRTFSILSQKLEAHFLPFLKGEKFKEYDFIVTQMGEGFLKDWNVQTILRPPVA